jgi:hypothetical protein
MERDHLRQPTGDGETRTEGHAMFHNRMTMESEPIPLPQPPGPALNPGAFILCAIQVTSLDQWTVQQWLYQRAFEAAEAVVRPSILERDLLGVWN